MIAGRADRPREFSRYLWPVSILAVLYAVTLVNGQITYQLTTVKNGVFFSGVSLIAGLFTLKRSWKNIALSTDDRILLGWLAAYFLILCVSLIWETHTYDTKIYIFQNIAYLVFLLLVVNMIHSRANLNCFIDGILVLGAVLTLAGALEFGGVLSFSGSADHHRLQATLGNPNYLGAVLVLIFPLVLMRTITIVRTIRQKPFKFIPLLMGVLIGLNVGIVTTLVLTLSRIAILSWIVECILLLALYAIYLTAGRRQALKRAVVWGIGGVVLIVLMGVITFSLAPQLKDRFTVHLGGDLTKKTSIGRRIVAWDAALRIWDSRPPLSLLFGRGYGSYYPQVFMHHDPDYRLLSPHTGFRHAHCEYLEILSESGIVALGIWVIVMGLTLRIGFKSLRYGLDRELKLISAGAVTAIMGMLCQMGVSVALRMPVVGLFFYTMVGLILVINNQSHPTVVHAIKNRKVAWVILGVGAVGLLWVNVSEVHYFLSEYYHLRAVRILNARAAGDNPEHLINDLKNALRWNPENVYVLYDIAKMVMFKQPQKALEMCDRIDGIIPRYKNTLRLKGISQILTQDFKGAVQSFKAYIQQDAIQDRNYLDLYIALLKTDQTEAAIEVLKKFFIKQNQYYMSKLDEQYGLEVTEIQFVADRPTNACHLDRSRHVRQADISLPYLKSITNLLHQNKQLSYNELYTNINIFVAQTFDQIQYGDVCLKYYLEAVQSGRLKPSNYRRIRNKLVLFTQRMLAALKTGKHLTRFQRQLVKNKIVTYKNSLKMIESKIGSHTKE